MIKIIATLIIFFCLQSQAIASQPQIQLANIYYDGVNVADYLVSEKLDGVRGYWDGKNLLSREGKVFTVPEFFTKNFPNCVLEGELWIGRGRFEEVAGIVNTQDSNNPDWRKIKFMLFDAPKHDGAFLERLEAMKKLVEKSDSEFLQVIKQEEVFTNLELQKKLQEAVNNGAEGLMLHKKSAIYQAKRNDDLLKLKTYLDAEAVVVSYIEGKGKYRGMMGALMVKNAEGLEFKIGGGFSDEQRKNPPKIGSVITYKYFGLTKNGKPRFASFLRVRQ